MRKKPYEFGAIEDDPVHIAKVAIEEFEAAVRKGSRGGLDVRQAANKGWLAASACADNAAAVLCPMDLPQGADSRRRVLEKLERAARIGDGKLTATFGVAKTMLHGQCFHENVCPTSGQMRRYLADVEQMARDTKAAIAKLPKKRRQ